MNWRGLFRSAVFSPGEVAAIYAAFAVVMLALWWSR